MKRWVVTGVVSCLLLATPARAQEIEWKKEWPRFTPVEGVVTGTLTLGIAGGFFLLQQRKEAWSGGILFDDGVRDATRIQSRDTRDAWVLGGDLTYVGSVLYPFLDAALGSALGNLSGDAMGQLLLIDSQALSMAGFVAVWTQKLGGRERPLVRECGADPDYDKDCDDDIMRNQSFLSGHTAIAFTGAGLICVSHSNLPLYGGGFPDALACGVTLGAASFVGATRLIADRHYASDVLAGVLVGGTVGFLLPAWWHFGLFDAGKGPAKTTLAIAPMGSPDVLGLSLMGVN
jgi:membrane-associated phospholipid phosphatase